MTTATTNSNISSNDLKDGWAANGASTHGTTGNRSDVQKKAGSATRAPPKIDTKETSVKAAVEYDSDVSPEEEESIDEDDLGFRGKQPPVVQGVKDKPKPK